MNRRRQIDAERLIRSLLCALPRRRGGPSWLAVGLIVACVAGYLALRPALESRFGPSPPDRIGDNRAGRVSRDVASGEQAILQAFARRQSDVMVSSTATVKKLLADDDVGVRHQKLLLRLPSGHSLLLAHNIDLAPRVPVRVGEQIEFRGEYEYSEQGGVIHWTHHDPAGRHADGWIEFRGKRFD
jgi:hypothetical protein